MTDHDPVKAPRYYLFPGDVQLRQITSHLTGNSAQAVQYIVRSSRLDGENKGIFTTDLIEDLEKAQEFVAEEIRRLSAIEQTRIDNMKDILLGYKDAGENLYEEDCECE